MATVTTVNTSYAGEFAGQYIAAALLSGNTLANGLITVKPNVKVKEVLKSLDYGSAIKDGSCNFTDEGTITLDERILEPEEFQVNISTCKRDYQSDWEAIAMGYSQLNQKMPPKFSDFFIARLSADVAASVETSIWQGDTAVSGQFNGFTTEFAKAAFGAAGGTTIAPVGGGIDSTNVLAEMGKVIDAIPSTLYSKEDMTIYVSQNVARAYVRALGGFVATIGSNGIQGNGPMWYNGQTLSFEGVSVVVANGLPDNRMVAAQKNNLYFGTGLLSDHNEVKLIDMADIDGSQNVRFVMRYTAGVQYGIAADIVYYGA